MNECPDCQAQSGQVKNGRNPSGSQRYKCKACGRILRVNHQSVANWVNAHAERLGAAL